MSGNLWMYSDKLDDQDILFAQHSFITYNMGSEYYGLSIKVFTRMAREAGAAYKIGKMGRVNREMLEEYLRKQRKVIEEEGYEDEQ